MKDLIICVGDELIVTHFFDSKLEDNKPQSVTHMDNSFFAACLCFRRSPCSRMPLMLGEAGSSGFFLVYAAQKSYVACPI